MPSASRIPQRTDSWLLIFVESFSKKKKGGGALMSLRFLLAQTSPRMAMFIGPYSLVLLLGNLLIILWLVVGSSNFGLARTMLDQEDCS